MMMKPYGAGGGPLAMIRMQSTMSESVPAAAGAGAKVPFSSAAAQAKAHDMASNPAGKELLSILEWFRSFVINRY